MLKVDYENRDFLMTKKKVQAKSEHPSRGIYYAIILQLERPVLDLHPPSLAADRSAPDLHHFLNASETNPPRPCPARPTQLSFLRQRACTSAVARGRQQVHHEVLAAGAFQCAAPLVGTDVARSAEKQVHVPGVIVHSAQLQRKDQPGVRAGDTMLQVVE